ncbi:heme o synthase [Virgibacillus sp. C22-A2]|uniref:Protoheme IX farnesyltransferase n=1 Tax=Virgibacillus tibetensis TaxID=3042313 RepID=A0ABU6KGC7_9BACI|nr:heme o synthase [Virgibacillus sp. C22-A2]
MRNEKAPSIQKSDRETVSSNKIIKTTLLSDLKSLFKSVVLIANVLPVLVGFWLALYFTNTSLMENIDLFLLTMIGSTLVMAGALVFNNWYEVDIDAVMARTRHRPTVTGNISLKSVFTISMVSTVLGFTVLLFTTMEATLYAFIGWFTYVVLYTMWSKRRYTLNTVIGSVSGAVTPLIGWAAIEPAFHIVPIMLFLILFVWQMPHTFAIAMKKYDEYKAAGVAMLPVVYGFEMTKRQMAVYITCLLPLPFFLASLGTTFIVIATVLNVGWIALAISGFFVKDDFKWAQWNFLYSVNYLMVLFIMMIIVTLPVFN